MDLKGYLVDTHLKIYPSEKLLDFLKTVPISDSLPHNILQIVKGVKGKFETYSIADQKPISFTSSDIETLNEIKKSYAGEKTPTSETEEKNEIDNNIPKTSEEQRKNNNINGSDNTEEKDDTYKESKNENDIYLVTADLNWLYDHLKLRRSNGEKDIPYLHTLLEDAHIKLPENKTIKRNPDLEARCVKLRAQQEAREYRKMTKGVDNVRMKFPEDSISYQCKLSFDKFQKYFPTFVKFQKYFKYSKVF